MKDDEWYKESQRRAGLVAQHFKPREIILIQDFLETAKDVSKEEAKEEKA